MVIIIVCINMMIFTRWGSIMSVINIRVDSFIVLYFFPVDVLITILNSLL